MVLFSSREKGEEREREGRVVDRYIDRYVIAKTENKGGYLSHERMNEWKMEGGFPTFNAHFITSSPVSVWKKKENEKRERKKKKKKGERLSWQPALMFALNMQVLHSPFSFIFHLNSPTYSIPVTRLSLIPSTSRPSRVFVKRMCVGLKTKDISAQTPPRYSCFNGKRQRTE